MDVLRRDSTRDAYLIRFHGEQGELHGWVPEELVADGLRPERHPSHEQAYSWLASNAYRIEQAMVATADGVVVKKPFDRITLAEND